ncbi:MAG: fasciclin domain-containing protein [Sphingomonas sp.]|uniref:fasciclin domain-containing protein n=1 Tax=Sphingomonas sp. TaxID=28214 RepID=UPI0017FD7931|nr:fasciclin domain-containing protein [Sphingomonas sp.]MBA3667117.1 fasciclin domain-containing protein [Sphingomonas sp.]
MIRIRMTTGGALALLLVLGACDQKAGEAAPKTEAAQEAAGKSTLADGLGDASKFTAAAKAAGLDGTLAGPGPYTVLVPSDAAFDKLPAGALDGLMKEDARAELTGVLTYHILPGTILAADIGKAIDAGKGKALLATMAGGTLTATRDGKDIIISDAAGTKARITGADEEKSNGIIHRIDAVLMPS